MKYKPLRLVAIFFMTIFYQAGMGGGCLGSATGSVCVGGGGGDCGEGHSSLYRMWLSHLHQPDCRLSLSVSLV